VVKIHNVVCVRTPYRLVPVYECFGGLFWVYLHTLSEDGHSMFCPKPQYPPVRLHSPITQKTIILNLNILRLEGLTNFEIGNFCIATMNSWLGRGAEVVDDRLW